MAPPACGCKVYGNQHGSWMAFCRDHAGAIYAAALATGETPEQFANRVVHEYAARVLKEESR